MRTLLCARKHRFLGRAWPSAISAFLGFVPAASPLAAASLPVGIAEVRVERVELELARGRLLQNHRIDLGEALAPGVVYKAEIARTDWDEGRLQLGFFSPREDPFDLRSGAEIRHGEKLLLRIAAERCYPASRHETEIRLTPQSGISRRRIWSVVLPVSLHIEREVEPCRGETAQSIVRAAVWGSFALYAYGMFANSRFLKKDILASRLKPLRWNGKDHVEDRTAADEVRKMVDHELRTWRRAWNWFRANPLVFGLPGRTYSETVELQLMPAENASRLILVPARNLYEVLSADPGRRVGLFVTAREARDHFFGVTQEDRLGEMIWKKRSVSSGNSERRDERVDLESPEKLVYNPKPGKQPIPRSGWMLV